MKKRAVLIVATIAALAYYWIRPGVSLALRVATAEPSMNAIVDSYPAPTIQRVLVLPDYRKQTDSVRWRADRDIQAEPRHEHDPHRRAPSQVVRSARTSGHHHRDDREALVHPTGVGGVHRCRRGVRGRPLDSSRTVGSDHRHHRVPGWK